MAPQFVKPYAKSQQNDANDAEEVCEAATRRACFSKSTTVIGAADRLIGMRGNERIQDGMFSHVLLEERVSSDHQLRTVRQLTDAVLLTRRTVSH